MAMATYKDIFRLFPGLQDHAVTEILDLHATIDELEAALVLFSSDDKDLIEIRRREGGKIHQLARVLSEAGIEAIEDRD